MSPDDMQRFEIYPDYNAVGTWLWVSCGSCPWVDRAEDPVSLAELVQRAEEHAEVCR